MLEYTYINSKCISDSIKLKQGSAVADKPNK